MCGSAHPPCYLGFPISRDPPEGGTTDGKYLLAIPYKEFPISRDPPEGGTTCEVQCTPLYYL